MADNKRAKRLIHGRLHMAWILHEPGLRDVTRRELDGLLKVSLQPLDDDPQVAETADGIVVSCLSFRRLLEISQRLQTAWDCLWIIAQKRVASPLELKKSLAAVSWDLFFEPESRVRVQADSVGSRLYHEGLMRECATEVLTAGGYHLHEKEGPRLKLFLRENHLSVALSLFEEPLYKRGNKGEGAHAAPLRETLAAGLIHKTATWLRDNGQSETFERCFVPFAGSGTLGWETWAFVGGFSWQAFFKPFSFQNAPAAARETTDYLVRQLRKRAAQTRLQLTLLDHHGPSVMSMKNTLARLQEFSPVEVSCVEGDFFSEPLPENAFVPLHPPYGERLGVKDVPAFYQRIARRLASVQKTAGFILIPSEAAWSAFLRELAGFRHDTWHVTQGGHDVRVVAFFKA